MRGVDRSVALAARRGETVNGAETRVVTEKQGMLVASP
jgi:hypothetical protein